MYPTEEQTKRIAREYKEIAGDVVEVEFIGDAMYVFSSEIGCLRLYKKFNGCGNVKFSINRNTWFYVKELEYLKWKGFEEKQLVV
jgi:hypothetical protein